MSQRSCIAAFAMLITGTSHAGPIIQWAGAGSNGHFYTVTDNASSWTTANALATSQGGYLASVLSQAENNFLQATFFPTAREAFWIGFTDQAVEGTFVWTSGESGSFTNWQSGEPNDEHNPVSPAGEDFAVINWFYANNAGPQGTWNDTGVNGSILGATSTQPYRGIIEFNTNPSAVPEPASVVMLGMGLVGLALGRRKRHSPVDE